MIVIIMIRSYIRQLIENNITIVEIVKDLIKDYVILNAKEAPVDDIESQLLRFDIFSHEHGSYFTVGGHQQIAKISYVIGKAPIIKFANDDVILKSLNSTRIYS